MMRWSTKRFIAVLLVLSLVIAMLSGCSGNGGSAEADPTSRTEESGTVAPETEPSSEPSSEPVTEAEEFDIFAVDQPMKELPVYTFDHEPTVDEMRATAVRAMHDMLSIQWYTPETFTYEKTGAVADKLYVFKQYDRYAGLPYTDYNASLFGFLEYYNQNTGRLYTDRFNMIQFPNLGQAVNGSLGNTCTGSTNWALMTVCNSIKSNMVSYTQTKYNGFYPVGDFTYDFEAQEFAMTGSGHYVTTTMICRDTGEQKMYECYALVKPADIMCSQGDNRSTGHTMMAIEDAVVVRNSDGSINGEESYVMIQDQRAGFYKVKDETSDVFYNYSGRIEYKYTFSNLFKEDYIPVTPAEFLGLKPYEKSWFKLSEEREITGPDDFKMLRTDTNYPMAVIKVVATDAAGKRTTVNSHIFNRAEIKRLEAYNFTLTGFAAPLRKKGTLPAGTYTVTLEATLSTGEVYVPVTFTYTVE